MGPRSTTTSVFFCYYIHMVVLPGKVIYLATPRSASRTTAEVLQKVGGAIHGIHHSRPATVTLIQQRSKLPTITLLRNPVHIIFSFWWGIREKQTFKYYVTTTFRNCFGERRIYPYYGVTDKYFPYDRGIKCFLEYLSLPSDVEIPQHGVRDDPPDHDLITDEYRQLVAELFPEDMKIYESFSL